MREYGVESSWTNASMTIFPHSVSTPYRILYLSKDVLILFMACSGLFVFNLRENTLVYPHIRDDAFATGKGVEVYVQSEVSPYARFQEIATKDKERYKLEMQNYREAKGWSGYQRCSAHSVPGQDVEMVQADTAKSEDENEDSPRIQKNENSFSDSDYEDDKLNPWKWRQERFWDHLLLVYNT